MTSGSLPSCIRCGEKVYVAHLCTSHYLEQRLERAKICRRCQKRKVVYLKDKLCSRCHNWKRKQDPQTHAHDLQVTRTRERIKRQHPEYRAKVNAQSRTWRQNPVNKAKVNKQRRKVAKLKRRIRRAVRKGQIMLYKPLSLVYVRPTTSTF